MRNTQSEGSQHPGHDFRVDECARPRDVRTAPVGFHSALSRRRKTAAALLALATTVFGIEATVHVPEAHAAGVTVGNCQVEVSVGGTVLGSSAVGAPGDNPTHVIVSEDDSGNCVLQFINASVKVQWTIPDGVTEVDALLVGGGGKGGTGGAQNSSPYFNTVKGAGGGGAGEFWDTTQLGEDGNDVPAVALTDSNDDRKLWVTVGAGGSTSNGRCGDPGADTAINYPTSNALFKRARGGGGGIGTSSCLTANSEEGGSGGGAAYLKDSSGLSPSASASAPYNSQGFGNSGGAGNSDSWAGSGGGGAGGAGSNAGDAEPSDWYWGGMGGASKTSSITGSSISYAGGGGGGAGASSGGRWDVRGGGGYESAGVGGTGGRLAGDNYTEVNPATSGRANTGSGGGGGAGANQYGGDGGSGIAVIRYTIPSISISSSDEIEYSGTLSLAATPGPGGGTATWSTTTPGCSISGTTLTTTLNAGGTCTVNVVQSDDGGSDTQTVTVIRAGQAALSVSSSGSIGFGGTATLSTSGGSGDGAVSWSETCADFSIAADVLSTTASVATTCVVSASKAQSTNYNSATATKTFTVVAATPVFDSYTSISAQTGDSAITLVDPTLTVNGSAFSSGTINWSSANTAVASVTGSQLTIGNAGTTTLTATFTPTDTASYQTVTLTVGVTVTSPPSRDDDDEDEPIALPASGNPPGAPGGGVGPTGARPPAPEPPTGPVSTGPGGFQPPSQPKATVGGEGVPTTAEPNDGGGTTVRAGSIEVDFTPSGSTGGDNANPGGPDQTGELPGQQPGDLPLGGGGQTTVAGGGLGPNAPVTIWFPGADGEGVALAQTAAGPNGEFSTEIDTNGNGVTLPIGRSVIQVTSFDADGNLVVIDVPVVIVQPAPAPQMDLSTESDDGIQISVDEPTRSVNYFADSWSLAITTETEADSVVGSGEQFSVTMTTGSVVSLTGTGFLAGTRVDIWMFSEPVLLGTFEVDDQGAMRAAVEITAAQIAPGDHTLQIQKVVEDGFIETTNLTVSIIPPPGESSSPNSLSPLIVSGIALGVVVTLAVFLLWLARRNSATTNSVP